MKTNLILVLGAVLASSLAAPAQPDEDTLRALAGHLRPKWIEAVSRADLPASDAVLASLDELQLADPVERPALVLVFSDDDQVSQEAFEEALFRHPNVVLAGKAFVCIRVDLRKDARLKKAYDGAVPRFMLFDKGGQRRADISMAGFRQRKKMLGAMMERVMADYGTMPLDLFVSEYAALLPDLLPIESEGQRLEARRAALRRESGADAKEELQRLDARRSELDAARKEWRAREKKLLQRYHGKT